MQFYLVKGIQFNQKNWKLVGPSVSSIPGPILKTLGLTAELPATCMHVRGHAQIFHEAQENGAQVCQESRAYIWVQTISLKKKNETI